MIRIENLCVTYAQGPFELSIPSLEVTQGEKVALVGPSGSGKTTLLNVTAGILVASRGAVEVLNQPLAGLSDRKRREFRIANIGYVFQDFELLDYLTAAENVVVPYRINPALALTQDVRERACTLLDQVGVGHRSTFYPHQLSQGEKQRVALCRALITRPRLLLADEATGNLDPKNKKAIMDILSDYVAESGATLLAATHDHSLLSDFGRTVDIGAFHSGEGGTFGR